MRGAAPSACSGGSEEGQLAYALEVAPVAGHQRQSVREGRGGDQRVVSASAGLASCTSEIGGHLAKGSSGRCIERERIEIGFGLLEMRLPGRTLRIGLGNEWTDRQLDECHGGYHRHGRQTSGINWC